MLCNSQLNYVTKKEPTEKVELLGETKPEVLETRKCFFHSKRDKGELASVSKAGILLCSYQFFQHYASDPEHMESERRTTEGVYGRMPAMRQANPDLKAPAQLQESVEVQLQESVEVQQILYSRSKVEVLLLTAAE